MDFTMISLLANSLSMRVPGTLLRGETILWGLEANSRAGVSQGIFSHVSTPTVRICHNTRRLGRTLSKADLAYSKKREPTSHVLWFRNTLLATAGQALSEGQVELSRTALAAVPHLTTGTLSLCTDPDSGDTTVHTVTPRVRLDLFTNQDRHLSNELVNTILRLELESSSIPYSPQSSFTRSTSVNIRVTGAELQNLTSLLADYSQTSGVNCTEPQLQHGEAQLSLQGASDSVAACLSDIVSPTVMQVPAAAVFLHY